MQSERMNALVEGAIKRNDSLILAAIEVAGVLGCSVDTAIELVAGSAMEMEDEDLRGPDGDEGTTNGTETNEPTEVAAKQAPGEPTEPTTYSYDGTPLTKVERFEILTARLADTYRRKNADYGDSFGKSVERYGIIAALTRMSDKWNRLENLILKGGESLVGDESVLDTLIDLAAYALMTFIEVEEKDS